MGGKPTFQLSKDIVLSAAHETLLHHSEYESLSTEDIHKRVEKHFARGFIERVLSSLSHERLVEVEQYDESSPRRYTLADQGFEYVEKLPPLSVLLGKNEPADSDRGSVPAADRTVTLDHNQSTVIEIADGLEKVSEDFRGINSAELDEGTRDRLTRSLDAAKTLWQSSELKLIQINVGVLMVLEEVQSYLKDTAKAASIAGLIELLKIFLST